MSSNSTKQRGSLEDNPSNIPIEIFQLIIDSIIEDPSRRFTQKQRDLRACSLVCRSFVALCQQHLFAETFVRPGDCGGLICQRIAALLNQSAHISNHIRRLVYVRTVSDITAKDATCLSVLLHLPRLQHLKFACMNAPMDLVESVNELFGPGLLLRHYLNLGTLTTLHLGEVKSLTLHDILSAPNLTSLAITSSEVLANTIFPPPPTNLGTLDIAYVKGNLLSYFQAGTPLETLCFQAHHDELFALPTIPEVFPHLKRLRTCVLASAPNDETRTINQIFETMIGLECLAVEAHGKYGQHGFPLRIRECVQNNHATLKRLHLYYDLRSSADSLWQSVYDVLDVARGRNIIQEIDIVVYFSIYLDDPSTFSAKITPSVEMWAKLDELLDEDISLFPCLEKVSVHIIVKDEKQPSMYRPIAIDRAEFAAFRTAVSRSFRRLMTNPQIIFRGRVGTSKTYMYHFPTIYDVDDMFTNFY